MMRNRKPNRLIGYDYSTQGEYFVTICVRDRIANKDVFGIIENGQIILNEIGLIVKKQWVWIPGQYNHISYDEWVIMPDHIHGIIKINPTTNIGIGSRRDRSRPVPTNAIATANANAEPDTTATGTTEPDTTAMAIKIKPLDQIIGAFKTTSSKLIHQSGNSIFAWQRSYHDHIIRDKQSLFNIRQYIRNNPLNWGFDIANNNDDWRKLF